MFNQALQYFSETKDYRFFFTDYLQNKVSRLHEALGTSIKLGLYPDAVLKSNGLPTGIACIAKTEDAMLLPLILRDPGCGYLTFKLDFYAAIEENWHLSVGSSLAEIIQAVGSPLKKALIKNIDLNEVITKGLAALNLTSAEMAFFSNPSFDIGADKLALSAEETRLLTEELVSVTNTVEIRTVQAIQDRTIAKSYSIKQNDCIGFIHTGSEFFPQILGKRFVAKIAKYAEKNGFFSFEEILSGIFGVPLNTSLGQEYALWLKAAMNYAVVNRYLVYQLLKQFLETQLPCRVSLINDNMHAGLFSKKMNNKAISYATRGVQNIFKAGTAYSPLSLTLLAGQRETIAALITGGENADEYGNLISHGTGCHIRPYYDYAAHFTTAELDHYLALAKKTFYNTTPNFSEAIPFTFNLLNSLEYFQKIKLARLIAHLAPLINIQSALLN